MAAGLSLRTGVSGSVGNYSPMTPASSGPPSGSATIAQKAYGITGTGTPTDGGSPVAGYGSVGLGCVALGALIYLWWSLPR
jgi:hypothetical protein